MFIKCPHCEHGRKRLCLVSMDLLEIEIDERLSTCNCQLDYEDIEPYHDEIQQASMDYEP
jgi:hypothetical protein